MNQEVDDHSDACTQVEPTPYHGNRPGAAPAQNECGTKRNKLKPMIIISVVCGIRNAE